MTQTEMEKTILDLQGQLADKTQALADLQNTQLRLKIAMTARKMGVWDWEFGTDNLHWDETMFHLYGITADELKFPYQLFDSLLLPQDRANLNEVLELASQGKKPLDTQFRIIRKDEIRYIRAAGIVIRDSEDKPLRMIGISWDITERVRNNELLQSERAKSVAASKMASLGEMASGIAHEINNPLSIISARAGQLKSRIAKDQIDLLQFTEDLDRIEITVHRIAKIIRGLLSFSRNGDEDPFTRCSMKIIIDEALDLCRGRFKKTGVTVEAQECKEVEINCRSVQILQVLVNLLNNSYDAIAQLPAPHWIRLNCEVKGDDVVIRITDSGTGIPRVIVDRVMEPFFTTKPVGQGTGLGLSITKGIVEDHHGKFWINTESENTEFVVELPARQQSQT